jgi:ferric-dicitrate binding protein FerR (iron transport regulator)
MTVVSGDFGQCRLEEAGEWFALVQDPLASAEELSRFADWLAVPANERAFAELRVVYDAVGKVIQRSGCNEPPEGALECAMPAEKFESFDDFYALRHAAALVKRKVIAA